MPIYVGSGPAPYATAGDYVDGGWGDDAPTTATLLRATEVIDDHLLTAVYDTDDAGYPTDPVIVVALRDATCAQVQYWAAGDEEDDIVGPVQGVSLSGMQLQYGAGENRATPMYLAPRAARLLRRAGLLSGAVESR